MTSSIRGFRRKMRYISHLLHVAIITHSPQQPSIIALIIFSELPKGKANWIGQILPRNCLLQQVIEGKIEGRIEVTIRRWRRRRKLLDDLKERRGYSHLKKGTLDRTMWRARFGRGFGPVVRQNTKWMNELNGWSFLLHGFVHPHGTWTFVNPNTLVTNAFSKTSCECWRKQI